MKLVNVSVAIRSADERTEQLCKELILEQGVTASHILMIKERPFSKALRVGLELGYEAATDWVYCIDADILLRPGAIEEMLEIAMKQDGSVCEIQGRVYDKFFGGPRPAGNHLYRRALIPEIIKRIPEEGVTVRPEYQTLQAMTQDGYSWLDLDTCVGLHDSEQFFKDVYRKCFVQAHKHAHLAELFLQIWRSHADADPDMRVALTGFADGISHATKPSIDTSQPYYSIALDRLGLEEKNPIALTDWNGETITSIIREWQISPLFSKFFPYATRETQKPTSSIITRLQYRLQKRGPFLGSAYLIGSVLGRLGRCLTDACD